VKRADSLLDASREVDVEENAEETKYKYNMKTGNKSFEKDSKVQISENSYKSKLHSQRK
jgi:hypothetical protein